MQAFFCGSHFARYFGMAEAKGFLENFLEKGTNTDKCS